MVKLAGIISLVASLLNCEAAHGQDRERANWVMNGAGPSTEEEQPAAANAPSASEAVNNKGPPVNTGGLNLFQN